MADPFPTLGDLFLGRKGQLPRGALKALESAERTRALRRNLQTAAPDVPWRAAWRVVKARLPELFEVSLLDLLLAGWEQSPLLAAYAARSQREPGRRHRLPLDGKCLHSEHRPGIDLLLGEEVAEQLRLTVRLHLEFAHAEATLENGELRALKTSDCTGSGEIRVGTALVLTKDFGRLPLPREVRFQPGLAVPTVQHPYPWGTAAARLAPQTVPAGATTTRPALLVAGAAILALGLLVGVRLDQEDPAPGDAAPVLRPEPTRAAAGLQASGNQAFTSAQALKSPPRPTAVPALPPAEPAPGASLVAREIPDPTFGLTVRTIPAEARVRIMNIVPPYEPGMRLPSGPYHIRVQQPGYLTEDRWIEITDTDRQLEISLQPQAVPQTDLDERLHRLVIHAEPSGSEVMLLRDGKLVPFPSGQRLPPGRYTVNVSASGYQPAIEIVEIEDDDKEIAVRLRRDLVH